MIIETNVWDILCNLCIFILENLSHITGLSYGFINIMLFVVLGPLATVLFLSSSVLLLLDLKKKSASLRLIAKVTFIIGLLIVLFVMTTILVAILEAPF